MWNISVRVLLLFVPVLFANVSGVSNIRNDCPKEYENLTIHACQDSSYSGPAVAMDASKFSGFYCECTLTTSIKTIRDCLFRAYVLYAHKTHRIQFSTNNITYTSYEKRHNFNGDSIKVVVEQTNTGDRKLRTGNPCMIFRSQGCSLTLSCSNGTDIDPRQKHKTSTANSETEKITTQLQQSPRPTTFVIRDLTTHLNKLQENDPTKSDGTTAVIIIVVVTVVCTAIIHVLIRCYFKRRKRSAIKSDENTIKPRKEDVFEEVKENAMYVPMEMLNEPSCSQGSTEPVYEQPDIDIIAIRAHGNETKPMLQGQEACIYENEVKGTVEQSAGDDKDITLVANSEKHTRVSQDQIPNEQKEQLYTQLDNSKSNNTTAASTEHIYNVLG